ncbi:Late competence protein ComEA DNA receptor [Furfurilactobacillus rossiae]|uniref:helix-hairpin-helix domain-containing protein n=1 Tax=Furfurilactobacillus rossiae TaxID=231049 RepID=UPI0015C17984|nr:ComEA family DNA-binding protein [Furfurilactobacillus rossiae]QLE64260.1 Late competence protein ComEA DNA receptor [Furfurilactobacillus rossiae]
MEWREALQDAWRQYRGWLLGGLAVMIAVGVIGAQLLKPNDQHRDTNNSMNGTSQSAFQSDSSGSLADATTKVASRSTKLETTSATTVNPGKLAGQTESMVEVKGAVNQPGVYHFKTNMRVINAIERAGGLRADADSKQINQAQTLHDQMVVYVPTHGEALPSTNTSGVAGGANTTTAGDNGATGTAGTASIEGDGADVPIGLNSATKEQLTKISGVGDKKAQKIIDFRTEHNGFKSLDDLKQISGFGEKTVQKLKPHLSLS